MIKLFIKLTLFFAGLIVYIIALSLMPLDTFTFRNWESMMWRPEALKLTIGKFYPDKKSVRDEGGDLGHNSAYNLIKSNITWQTDKYGFRNDGKEPVNYEIVLVGDSNSVGCGTTQELILSNQLARKTGYRVFNFSPMQIDKDFVNNLSDMKIHPKIIIYQVIEREIPKLKEVDFKNATYTNKSIKRKIKNTFLNVLPINIQIANDRLKKKEPLNFIKGKIDSSFGNFNLPVVVGKDDVLFYKKSFFTKNIESTEVKAIATNIAKLEKQFNDNGIGFIFVPVPNKESIYLELLPENKLPLKGKDFLINLKQELDSQGVTSVDIYSHYREAFLAGNRIYFPDDTHWNKSGIELAANLIAQEIKNRFPIK